MRHWQPLGSRQGGLRAVAAGLFAVSLFLLSFVASDATQSGAIGSAPPADAVPRATSASGELAAARTSLATGQGPARLGAAAVAPQPNWTLDTPSASGAPDMVYDAADGYVVLLDGFAGTSTWTYSAGHWTQLPLVTSPAGRAWASMAYDPADHEVVLFGGVSGGYGSYSAPFYNTTWTFQAGRWTAIVPNGSAQPPARAYASMAFDAKDGYLVLFGGTSYHCTYYNCFGTLWYNDTWTFLHGAWSRVRTGHFATPPARYDASAATDGPRGGVLLFGGAGGGGGGPPAFGDSWEFSAGKWSNITARTAGPGARFGASMAYDPARGQVVMFGGLLANLSSLNETWTFNGAWHQVRAHSAPPATPVLGPYYPGSTPLVYDPALASLVLFGIPIWEFAKGTWKELQPHALPPASDEPLLAYDAKDGYVLLFEGDSGTTWKFWYGHWTELLANSNSTPAPYTAGSSLVYDAADQYVLLVVGGWTNPTWTYSGGVWTHLVLATAPSPRLNPGMAYDTQDGYVVLFGGSVCFSGYFSTGCQEFNDSWEFLGGAWTLLSPARGAAPPGRHAPSMTDDPAAGFVLLFGGTKCNFGIGGCAVLNDTWSFAAGAWTNLSLSVSPTPRGGAALAYDGRTGSVVLFGGSSVDSSGTWNRYFGDSWKFQHGSWGKLHFGSQSTPLGRVGAGFVGVPGSGKELMFGGNQYQDVWFLRPA